MKLTNENINVTVEEDAGHFNHIRQNNTYVNVLRYKDGVWQLVLMNSVARA